jgi:hypothetical protein
MKSVFVAVASLALAARAIRPKSNPPNFLPVAPVARPSWRAPAALAGIAIVAIASQICFGAFGDISWMLTIGEAWLDGKTPYVDFIETNPPASLLIYMPAVAAARALGVRPEAAIVAEGLLTAVAMLAASAAILRRAGLLERLGPVSSSVALVALTILPGRTFDERDFFAVLLGFPSLAVAVARAERGRVNFAAAIAAGLGAGAMIAIKPPYALIAPALLPYLWARLGWRKLAAAAEVHAAAALLFGYAALVVWGFPAYLADVWPTVAAAYLPVRESVGELLANAGVVLVVALLALTPALAGLGVAEPLVAVPALAAIGATAAYFVQGKGWLYHLYPALALAALAVGAALETRARGTREIAVAAAISGLTYAGSVLLGLPAIPMAVGLALAARFLVPGFGGVDAPARLPVLAVGALIGAGCGLFAASFPAPTRDFVRALRSFGPHPRIAAISEGLGAGFPLTRNVDGVWVQRTQGLLMTAGARYLIATHPGDAALAARLAPIIARDRDMVAEDIASNRPDAILIGRIGTGFARWALEDSVLKAALRDYRPLATNSGADWPYELYARANRIGLRPTLTEHAAAR